MLKNGNNLVTNALRSYGYLACTQTLYFLFKVRRARVLKYKPQGNLLTASARGSGVSFSRSALVFALAHRNFEKNEKKKKTTSVYRLTAASEVKIVHEAVDRGSPTECFHSRGQHLCKFIETKENVCIRKEFNSHRPTRLGH